MRRIANVRRLITTATGVLALGATLALAVPASSQAARAHASSTTCHLTHKDWRSFGYSYFEWLWVNHTTCSTGRYVAKHHGHVRGWRCTRKITAKASFQYDATETCKSGRRIVQWKYTQNT